MAASSNPQRSNLTVQLIPNWEESTCFIPKIKNYKSLEQIYRCCLVPRRFLGFCKPGLSIVPLTLKLLYSFVRRHYPVVVVGQPVQEKGSDNILRARLNLRHNIAGLLNVTEL